MMRAALPLLATLALAACNGAPEQSAAPASSEAAEGAQTSEAAPAVPAAETAAGSASPDTGSLDTGALAERKDPARLLAYLSAAVAQGKWADAARAWGKGEMDGAKLKAELGGADAPRLAFGTGTTEGAAGSLYYETSIEVAPQGAFLGRRGTITLRRVNDVPGADDRQLAWHVERIEWQDGANAS